MAISPQPTKPNRLTQTQAEFSINASNIVDWQGEFADELNAVSSTYLLGVTATSTTSNTLDSGVPGDKTFTVASGLGFSPGNILTIANTPSPANAYAGYVKTYSGTTLVVTTTSKTGSGTYTAWTIALGAAGASSAGAVSATPSGNLSGTTVQAQLQELDTEKLSSAAGAVTGTNLEDIITAGSIGSTSQIPVITYDANGRMTATSSAAKITSGTAIATTSGTSHDFTGIPSTVKRITLMLSGVSTNGTSPIIVQLGTSGGVQTTSYNNISNQDQQANNNVVTSPSTGFQVTDVTGSQVAQSMFGQLTITLINSNEWVVMGAFGTTTGTVRLFSTVGSKSLGAALDRIRLTTVNGTDTFDAGSINILME